MAAANAADAADAADIADIAADGEGAFAYAVSDVYADRTDVNATTGAIGDEIAAANSVEGSAAGSTGGV